MQSHEEIIMLPSDAKKNKTVIIGLDAATFSLIAPWIEDGKLPNIKKLMDQGCSGVLTSTVPPLSPVAWTALMTGMNPGNHGIFDFVEPVRDGFQKIRMSSRRDCKQNGIWNYLNHEGYKTIIVNVPMTFPPAQLDGIMISGMDSPSIKSEFVYPPEFKEELFKNVPEYMIDLPHGKKLESKTDKYIAALRDMIRIRLKATHYMLDNKDWDFFMVVFMAADRAQHGLWKFMDPGHPEYTKKLADNYQNAILWVYQDLDNAVGEIVGRMDPETTIAIVSDHGADAVYKTVHLNTWLLDNGFLALNRGASSIVQPLLRLYDRSMDFLKEKMSIKDAQSYKFFNFINWQNTKAYFIGSSGKLFINLKGREQYGVVEPGQEYEDTRNEIIEKLLRLKDPHTGKSVVSQIKKREDIYKGDCYEQAPDLVIVWEKGYNSIIRLNELKKGIGSCKRGDIFGPSLFSGDHIPEGIFIIKSPGIEKNRRDLQANIIDICPTLLYIMGVPVPRSMDGRVLQELFKKAAIGEKPVIYAGDSKKGCVGPEAAEYSPEEEREIEERLRDLGYLS
jgi:predicted AlkP superfamily phosphohydrolase/phosphomutase